MRKTEREMELGTKTQTKNDNERFCPPGKDLPFFSVTHANINN